MKKVVSILLIISSLFTLSSSIASCAAPEVPETSKVEASSDINSVSEKDITKEDQVKREEKIKKFLDEKRKYFPENKLTEIKSLLQSLKNDELEVVLSVNFKKPGDITLAAILGGYIGLDSVMLGDKTLANRKFLYACNAILTIALHGASYWIPTGSSFIGGLFRKFNISYAIIVYGFFVFNYIKNISTASARAKVYNYQLLLSTIGKK